MIEGTIIISYGFNSCFTYLFL
ncbi:hypothetical protein CY0110_17802 [Crocosphaera chwakensis CCY0110]|uniref:Uncharacterized protein n=1 Tax=Crocosphaera chwakensis CCY0110 TaxID=391612 RepID=A3IIP2_9CHRO|nr:hypothetical protein CY0110_17802 [Crocosphaera chwakensis CCY0110]